MKKYLVILIALMCAIMLLNSCRKVEQSGHSEKFWNNHDQSQLDYKNLLKSFSSEDIIKAEDYPENYGGVYIDGEGILNIYTTGNVDEVKKEYAERTGNDNITIKKCEYSFRELTEAMDTMNSFMSGNPDNEITKNISGYSLMDVDNCIIVELKQFSQEKIDEFKQTVLSKPFIKFIQSEGEVIAN